MSTLSIELLASALLGGVVGYLAERVPVSQPIQSVGAVLLGGFVALVSRSVLWVIRTSNNSGIAAVSFGIVESLGSVALVVTVALVAHWVLGWAGSSLRLPLAAHRPLILGLLAGLCGALLFPSGRAIPAGP
jgi:hypothetical protein